MMRCHDAPAHAVESNAMNHPYLLGNLDFVEICILISIVYPECRDIPEYYCWCCREYTCWLHTIFA